METFGIHTRVHYIIKKSGGLDWNKRKDYLKRKYRFTEDVVNRVYRYPIESMLEKFTLDDCLDRINKYEKRKEQRDIETLALLSGLARKMNSFIKL